MKHFGCLWAPGTVVNISVPLRQDGRNPGIRGKKIIFIKKMQAHIAIFLYKSFRTFQS